MSIAEFEVTPKKFEQRCALPAAEPNYSVLVLHSIDELRNHAEAWDDLWARSEALAPSFRAELVAQWVEHFAPSEPFCAVVVQCNGEFVAAIPLIRKRMLGAIDVAVMPSNDWSVSGELLLDEATDFDAVLEVMARAVRGLKFAAFWLDHVPIETTRWRSFAAAMKRLGSVCATSPHYRVGQVAIGSDFAAYEATLNGDHRRSRARYGRMLEKAGPTELKVYTDPSPREAARLLKIGFDVENRSWKGKAGTSVLQTPGAADFYLRQAEVLARWGYLEMTFLEHNGQPIAFDHGWRAKGTHFVCKLGYDDEFRKYGPGQQMMSRLLSRLHDDPTCERLDFWGPLVPWNESWATESYVVGRLAMSTSPVVGRTLLLAYRDLYPRYRKWRDHRAVKVNLPSE